MRKKIVAGNWKMHGSLTQNLALLKQLRSGLNNAGSEVVVFPPFPYLAQSVGFLAESGISVGGQNLSEHAKGAFTGEISGGMLADIGCRYVLVGHSERRSLYGETDALVAEKFKAAQDAGLIPVLCLGESLAQRQAEQTTLIVLGQLKAVIERVGVESLARAVLAYEPVWAIGTGLTATPEQAQQVHGVLRSFVADLDSSVAEKLQILYGGSVKAQNAAELFSQADIDGGLVGGASLLAEEFLAICRAVN